MGRKKLAMRRIENAAARQLTYTKRKDSIVKKAKELSVLCDTDVGLIMFSPTGRLTILASNGRVEDIFLRFVDRPDELRGGPINNEELLSGRLKQIKYEGEMLEKIAIIEDLEEKLDKLNRRQRESQEKMRYYEPTLENINSALEAGVYQQFLTSSIQRIQLTKAKLLGSQHIQKRTEIEGSTAAPLDDATSVSVYEKHQNGKNRKRDEEEEEESGTNQSMEKGKGPHLSLSFIEARRQWNKISNEMRSHKSFSL